MSRIIESSAAFEDSIVKALSALKLITKSESLLGKDSEEEEGYILTMLTDKFDIQLLKDENIDRNELFEKGIEIRIFNQKGEVKWFRSSIDKEFRYRERLMDSSLDENADYWDEEQYLDIDEKQTKALRELTGGEDVITTGGGRYHLPCTDYHDIKVKIRNYLEYEKDTMQVYIADWRIVDFVSGRGNRDGSVY